MKQLKRLNQLDGLRGLAILMVVLNHFRLTPLLDTLSPAVRAFFSSLTGSGKIGVCILFLLSGYLMATMYPRVSSVLDFWQKRYTRIFPPLIAMVLALGVVRYAWESLTTVTTVALVLASIIVGGVLWRIFQKLPQRKELGRALFCTFLLLQVATAVGYVVLQAKVPPSVFFHAWPETIRSGIFTLVNATLTLPFGNYVPQLDGVYWSLIPEVSFYLLYPILFLPLFRFFGERKSSFASVIAIFLSVPFIIGLSILSRVVLGFHMMNLHFVVYFIAGISIGLYENSPFVTRLQLFGQRLPSLLLIILGFASLFGLSLIQNRASAGFMADTFLWVVPISLMFIWTIGRVNAWSQLLTFQPLVTLGKYSYALYLTHTIAIELFVKIKEPTTVTEALMAIWPALAVMFVLTAALHFFLELPYFSRIAKTQKALTPAIKTFQRFISPFNISLTLLTLVFILVWCGFNPPVTLTAQVKNHLQSGISTKEVILTTPTTLVFSAASPNFGMILLHLQTLSNAEINRHHLSKGTESYQQLSARLFDENNHIIAENKYLLYSISADSRFHQVGLPLMSDSLGKSLSLQLQLEAENTNRYVSLVTSNRSFQTVYFFHKGELLKQPKLLVALVVNRLTTPFMDQDAHYILFLTLPFAVFLGVATLRWKKTLFFKSL